MSDRSDIDAISIVMPVRNGQRDIVDRVGTVLAQLEEVGIEDAELLIVDDGSQDRTYHLLCELRSNHRQIRIIRHDRPRGLQVCGQTGLERARGRLILIQEDQLPFRTADLQELLKIAEDKFVLAARVESRPLPPSSELTRRLKSWGASLDGRFDQGTANGVAADTAFTESSLPSYSGIQLIRRPHLKAITSPAGNRIRLTSKTSQQTKSA